MEAIKKIRTNLETDLNTVQRMHFISLYQIIWNEALVLFSAFPFTSNQILAQCIIIKSFEMILHNFPFGVKKREDEKEKKNKNNGKIHQSTPNNEDKFVCMCVFV